MKPLRSLRLTLTASALVAAALFTVTLPQADALTLFGHHKHRIDLPIGEKPGDAATGENTASAVGVETIQLRRDGKLVKLRTVDHGSRRVPGAHYWLTRMRVRKYAHADRVEALLLSARHDAAEKALADAQGELAGIDPTTPAGYREAAALKRNIAALQAEVKATEADEQIDTAGNVLCNAGIQRMEDLLIGAGGQALDSTHSRVGVGDGTTAASASDTDLSALSGSSHRQFYTMDSTYPSRSGQVITWRSTFASSDANFHWQELCVDAGTVNGTTVTAPMLLHKVTDLGTKATGSWQLSVTVTIS